jgi:hypothetical protein
MSASAEPMDVEAGGGGGLKLPPEPEEKGPLKPIAETTPLERVFAIVAGGALATSLAAIIIEQSAIVVVAGVLSCVMGKLLVDSLSFPTCIFSQHEHVCAP